MSLLLIVLGLWAAISFFSPTPAAVISPWPGPGGTSNDGNAPAVIRGNATSNDAAAQNPMVEGQIDAYLNDLASQGQWSGAALVARNGTILLSKGYGMANASSNTPNTPATRFRLASVTKQFTAMAVMQLVNAGKIGLDESACAYVPDCPGAWQPIKIRHLLSHTSGLANFTDFGSYEATMGQATTPEELVSRFRDMPLAAAPGTVYRYGNSGYVLLGYIIERVSGQRYGEYLREHIFAPLGMGDSGYDVGSNNVAQGYVAPGVPCAWLDASTLFSAGGLYSSVTDMYRWDQALYTSVLLPDTYRSQIFTPQAGSYGFGWLITQYGDQRVVEHPGLMSGAATHIARLPDAGITVIVLSNLETADVDGITRHLIGLALD